MPYFGTRSKVVNLLFLQQLLSARATALYLQTHNKSSLSTLFLFSTVDILAQIFSTVKLQYVNHFPRIIHIDTYDASCCKYTNYNNKKIEQKASARFLFTYLFNTGTVIRYLPVQAL